jgi:predicted XRE-type DNA-binding protein
MAEIPVDGPYANVWDALIDDPVKREIYKLRSDLMMDLKLRILGWKVSPETAAERLQVTPQRVQALLKDRFNEFSLEDLEELTRRSVASSSPTA